ncbi:TPA: hypothetical protein ACFP4K_001499 [Neisseria subflava]|nr:hypothetical protein [uncultured Neisseria sp.]
MTLFIGFAPYLYFMPSVQKTAPLFQKWLYYGLATIFSTVMLGVMAEISMDLVGNIAITDAVSNIAAALTGGNVGGIMQTVTQQLGLGLMLSTLLITVPPMAGAWFNGMMAGFSAYSVIGNGNRQEVPPHLDGGASQRVNYDVQNPSNNSIDKMPNNVQYTKWTTGGSQSGGTTTDAMKHQS